MTFEPILISTLFLTHLTIPSQFLQAYRFNAVAYRLWTEEIVFWHFSTAIKFEIKLEASNQFAKALMLKSTRLIRLFSTDAPLVKTAFYDLHLHLGGKIVPFAGYHLPVQVRQAEIYCQVYNFLFFTCSTKD